MSRAVLIPLAAVGALAACNPETTPRWELVHDRIVAVRASQPGLAPGGRADLALLVTSTGDGPAEVPPLAVEVAPGTPAPLVGAVSAEGGWHVDAPGAPALDAARLALGLDADAPVPLGLVVTVAIDGAPFVATKTVWLGEAADNPVIAGVMVGGAAVEPGEQASAAVGEIELAVDAPAEDDVAWLTSIGDLEDVDDAIAHLTVDEPADGQLVVVVRDGRGGLAWRVFALRVD